MARLDSLRLVFKSVEQFDKMVNGLSQQPRIV
jgi:hypothetical protein